MPIDPKAYAEVSSDPCDPVLLVFLFLPPRDLAERLSQKLPTRGREAVDEVIADVKRPVFEILTKAGATIRAGNSTAFQIEASASVWKKILPQLEEYSYLTVVPYDLDSLQREVLRVLNLVREIIYETPEAKTWN